MGKIKVVGKSVMATLADFKPNGWNPNELTPFQMASLKYGLETEGWLAAQALLVWRTDEDGNTMNVIIDGEHRWQIATADGMKKGPVVFLDNMTEAKARKLTIRMNEGGEWDRDKLGQLIREIDAIDDSDDLGMEIGLDDEFVMAALAIDPDDLETSGAEDDDGDDAGGSMRSAGRSVKQVQLFFDEEQHAKFSKAVKKLAGQHGTENVTETVLAVVLAAAKPRRKKKTAA